MWRLHRCFHLLVGILPFEKNESPCTATKINAFDMNVYLQPLKEISMGVAVIFTVFFMDQDI